MYKIGFVGHRRVVSKRVYENLLVEIAKQINLGRKNFIMGTHGEFDRIAFSACKSLQAEYPDIKIEIVITSLNMIKKGGKNEIYFSGVDTVMFDIEEVYYKQKITVSNRKMIDDCDVLICYVNEKAYKSGAKTAMKYAMKKGIEIINIYHEKDQPFYGMTNEEIEEFKKNFIKSIK